MKNWFSNNWHWVAAAALLIGISVAAPFLPLADWAKKFSDWVGGFGAWGVFIFAVVYALATAVFLPGSVLTLAGGLVFGVGLGLVASWGGAVLGASLAFLIGRYVARSRIEQKAKANPRFQAIDEAIGQQGWKIIALLRLSPLIPFNASNYFYGVTKIGFWPYVLATAFGILPGTLLYVYLGAAGKVGLGGGQQSSLKWVLFGVGLVATVAVSIWVSRIAKTALKNSEVKDPK